MFIQDGSRAKEFGLVCLEFDKMWVSQYLVVEMQILIWDSGGS